MVSLKNILICLFLSSGLSGCLFDSGVLWEDEQFNVIWIDTNDPSLHFQPNPDSGGSGAQKVGPTIIAVGSDTLYVVAKRRTENNKILYYYIEKNIAPHVNTGGITNGPFEEADFARLQKELDLPPFEKYFD